MRNLSFIICLFLLSYADGQQPISENKGQIEISKTIKLEFQKILDAAGVHGSILIKDKKGFYSNDFEWAKNGQLPASTFKIPNSLIALELGVLANDNSIIEWDGKPRNQKRWEQDLTFHDAFHFSCVPCYQEIARNIGVKQLNDYLAKFNYGTMRFDSTNLDMFWLEGESEINQFQQIDFLKRFNENDLPISDRTQSIMMKMMVMEENERFVMRGKTGWSITDSIDNCWFVGFAESDNECYYFATNIELKEGADRDSLSEKIKLVTYKALETFGELKRDKLH